MPEELVEQPQVGAEQVKPAVEPDVKTEEFDKERAMATIEKLREFERLSKQQAKKLAEFEAKEKERQDAELSETERLKKQLAEREATLNELTHAYLQKEVAEKVGLPAIFAKRLQGETAEEMEADAKQILEAMPKAGQPKIGATNPGANATGKGETDKERLAKLYGQDFNIFDQVSIKKAGGGVYFGKTVEDQT